MKFLKELVSKGQTTECFKRNGNDVLHLSSVIEEIQRYLSKECGLT